MENKEVSKSVLNIVDEEKTKSLLFLQQKVLDEKRHLIHYYDLEEEFDAIRSVN